MKAILLSYFLILFLFLTSSAQSFDANFTPSFTTASSIRSTFELEDGGLLIGGSFSFVNNVRVNKITRLDQAGQLDPNFKSGTGFNRSISHMAQNENGQIFVAGAFTEYDGQKVGYLVRLFLDGTLDPSFNTGSGFDGIVDGFVELADGAMIVIGRFENYNGQTAKYIAKLLSDGTLDTTFNQNGSGPTDAPTYITQQSAGKFLLALNINQTYNDVARSIIRIDANGAIDDSFQFVPTESIFTIRKIIFRSDGAIGVMAGAGQSRFMLLTTDGTILDEVLEDTELRGIINNIEADEAGNILIGVGNSYSGVNVLVGTDMVVYKYNSGGALSKLSVFGSTNQAFSILKVLKNDVYLMLGYFDFTLPDNRSLLVKVFGGSFVDESFKARIEGFAWTTYLAPQADGKIIVGGTFHGVNNNPFTNLCRLLPNGSSDPIFKPVFPGNKSFFRGLAIQPDGKIVVSTNFDNTDGIHRLMPDGSIDPSFNFPTAAVPNRREVVDQIFILPDGRIGATGNYLVLKTSSVSSNGIVWLNSDGSIDENFTKAFESQKINDLRILPDQQLLITGHELSFKGNAPATLIKITQADELDGAFSPVVLKRDQSRGTVFSMDIEADGSIILGGNFNRLNDQPIPSGIVCLNPDGTLKENCGIAEGLYFTEEDLGFVRTLKSLKNGYTLVGGRFNFYNNIPVGELILLDEKKQLVKSFPFYNPGGIWKVEADENWVYVGGSFLTDTLGTTASIARFDLQTVSTSEPDNFEIDLFKMTPNIVQDQMRITIHPDFGTTARSACLYDLQGRRVKSWKNLDTNIAIDLPNHLQSGPYFLQLSVGGKWQTKRLIKL